jgi:hypothetical protein
VCPRSVYIVSHQQRECKMASAIETTLGNTETSLTLLKVLAANSFDSILITDATASGKITYANKAFRPRL